jgi:beta-galactosidase
LVIPGLGKEFYLTRIGGFISVIAGVDNGNQISHESFKAKQRKAFHGMALAIVQTKQKPGRIILKASSAGLPPASVVINAR